MNIGRNSLWNIAEVALSTVVLFLIYNLIIARLSIASLGVWSLVLAATSMARLADVGVAGGLVRYVARARAGDGSRAPAMTYVETAFLTNLGLYLGLGLLIYWPAWHALGWAVSGNALVEARHLLPYAIISFVLLNLSSIVSSALIGFYRSDLRSMLALLGLAVQLAISWITVRAYGLAGLALGQIAQYVLMCVLGWLLVLRIDGHGKRFQIPRRLNIPVLREMLGFGLRLQTLNLASLLYEPATKFVFSALAGPAALGLYEVAFRLVLQTRSLILAPGQNLTPMFASIADGEISARQRLFQLSTAGMAASSAIALTLIAIASPVISVFWLHRHDMTFTLTTAVLCMGWFVNIVSAPAYLMGIATGQIRWNIVGSLVGSITSPLLGFVLWHLVGNIGIVIGAATATALSALITLVLNARTAGFDSFLPRRDIYGELFSRFWRSIAQLAER